MPPPQFSELALVKSALPLVALLFLGCAHHLEQRQPRAKVLDASTVQVWDATGRLASATEAEHVLGTRYTYWTPTLNDIERTEQALFAKFDDMTQSKGRACNGGPARWAKDFFKLHRVYVGVTTGTARVVEVHLCCHDAPSFDPGATDGTAKPDLYWPVLDPDVSDAAGCYFGASFDIATNKLIDFHDEGGGCI